VSTKTQQHLDLQESSKLKLVRFQYSSYLF